MSVEGYAHTLVYFEAWYYVPSGYCFDICGEYIDLGTVECTLLIATRGGTYHIAS